MLKTARQALRTSAVVLAGAVLLSACADDTPVAPETYELNPGLTSFTPQEKDQAIVTLRQATRRYRDIENAVKDGFVLLHDCEVRPGEGPVGTVYVHFGRVLDGVVDPTLPDALIYEPQRNGRLTLVGVEFAVLISSEEQDPPTFLGVPFQREDEFGVFALHAWVWRHNPDGLFAEANPRVSCSDA
jgi:hypothetical protein